MKTHIYQQSCLLRTNAPNIYSSYVPDCHSSLTPFGSWLHLEERQNILEVRFDILCTSTCVSLTIERQTNSRNRFTHSRSANLARKIRHMRWRRSLRRRRLIYESSKDANFKRIETRSSCSLSIHSKSTHSRPIKKKRDERVAHSTSSLYQRDATETITENLGRLGRVGWGGGTRFAERLSISRKSPEAIHLSRCKHKYKSDALKGLDFGFRRE